MGNSSLSNRSHASLIVCISLLSGCATTGSPLSPGNESTIGSLGTAISRAFSNPVSEFKQAIDQKRYLQAADYYMANEQKFRPATREIADAESLLTTRLNYSFETDLASARIAIDELGREQLLRNDSWRSVSIARQNAQRAQAKYDEIVYLREPSRRSLSYAALQRSLDSLDARLMESSWDAFMKAGAQPGFFNEYPLRTNASNLFSKHEARAVSWITKLDPDELRRVSNQFENDMPAAVRAALQRRQVFDALTDSSGAPRPFWDIYKDLPASFHDGSIDGVMHISMLILSENSQASPFKVTLPGASESAGMSLEAMHKLPAGAIVIAIQRNADLFRKIENKQRMQGQYVSGERHLPNPAFAVAQSNVIRAQSELNSTQFRNALQRPQGLIGAIVQGMSEGVSAANLTRAQQALAETPTTIPQKVLANYEYDVTTVAVKKQATYDVLFVDRSTGRYKKAPLLLEADQRFVIAYGLRNDDTRYVSYATENDLEQWERQALSMDRKRLMSLLDDAARVSDNAIASVEAEFAPRIPAQSVASVKSVPEAVTRRDSRFASVVVIKTPAGILGSGFYVDDYLVVTNHHVIEGSRLVEFKTFDGRDGIGQVVKSDMGSDLALVRVTQKGQPAEISDANLSPGDTVDAIGHPRGLEFSLTRGVVSAVRKMRNFVSNAPGEVWVIQTDTPINPGNSGGPLFKGSTVVGVNTQKLSRGAEGLGFAVFASDLQKFLRQP
ncbi:MAG TPA: trypsin-like peptidase domain-containing protein [Burkholderiaceae bacterium]|nr:trypsin-like peptidase domain-containing protein [Burkholderiaceae bacterium]